MRICQIDIGAKKNIPSFNNRKPAQIVTEEIHFESSGRIYRALSWLDYAKRNKNVSALEYAAIETRLGIEQLILRPLQKVGAPDSSLPV